MKKDKNNMIKITEYFKNAVAAATQSNIDYKEEKFDEISYNQIELGILSQETVNLLRNLEKEDDIEKDMTTQKTFNVIIALKTISTKFSDAVHQNEDIEEMTSVLFLPAKLTCDGKLQLPEDGKMPWIPRGFLEPMIEAQISIGEVVRYDAFFETTTDKRNQIDTWQNYLEYAVNLFEYVTETSFSSDVICYKNNRIEIDGKFYIFMDKTVYATFHILELYNHLLREGKENPLYSKLTNGQTEPPKVLLKNSDISKMKEHVGQMGAGYPLSSSQREVMNHFSEMKNGDILAVNGPPGTGKTTLLQSVVSNMYVTRALNENEAPIIVAASTNNQAVTNIIDSFGKVDPVGIKNLEKRWITGVHSFATYFPSKGKIKEAKDNNYQYTNMRGEFFLEEIEAQENREAAEALFLKEYETYFGVKATSLKSCKDKILAALKEIDRDRITCLSLLDKIKNITKDNSCTGYLKLLEDKIFNLMERINLIDTAISETKNLSKQYNARREEWRKGYRILPWYVRLLKFIPCFKNRIDSWSYSFILDDELEYLKRSMSIDQVESIYFSKIDEDDFKIINYKKEKEELASALNKLEAQKNAISKLIDELKCAIENFAKYNIDQKWNQIWNTSDICKINDLFDKIRYAEFWLAVHYYECQWILEENPITKNQRGTTFENVLTKMYHRLAMLSPCMVMTFFMLPKQFSAYNSNEHNHYYMYDYIDLLVVDEAGQISPEIAAPSFSLAKKAIVVGDEHQIPPVWGTVKALDVAMAIKNGVITDKESYFSLEENGLNCSQSSIMKIASLSCAYNKYENGLFLREHHRCFNEIIEYCNKLVYNGNLKALRGSANTDMNPLKGYLPSMGYKAVATIKSQRIGCSRQNRNEAIAIVEWLKANYSTILKKYLMVSKKEMNDKEILGIITPFKSQSRIIKNLLDKEKMFDFSNIAVGTVHTFQGAERKVILFSSVYGKEDGCFFINKNRSLMNVAVSRAKDSFLIFGDRECLIGGQNAPAGLLKDFTPDEITH